MRDPALFGRAAQEQDVGSGAVDAGEPPVRDGALRYLVQAAGGCRHAMGTEQRDK